MRDTKRELFIFTASDTNAMEDHFEEMARKGWMLDKINEYSVKYKRIDPRELKFDIELFPKLSVFDYPDNEDVIEYRNLCMDAGWEFIAATNKFQVFYSDKKDNLPPIQTDDRVKQSIVNKSLLNEIIILALCLPVFIWSLGRVFPLDYNRLDSNTSLALAIIGPTFIIPIVNYIGSYIIWMLRAKRAIDKELPLPKTSYKALRFRTLLLLYPTLLFILSLIIGLIFDLLNGNFVGLFALLPTAIGLTVGTLFKKNKNRKKRSKNKNIALFILVIIVMVIGMNLVLVSMLKLFDIKGSEELKEGYKGLRLSDFELTSPDYSRFSREGSIVLPKHSTYYEISRGYDGHHVRTNYIKAINNKIAKYVFNGMIEENASKYNRTITPASVGYEYFDEVFFIDYPNNDRSIILLKDNEIFDIDSSFNLTDENNINIIINKLIN